MTTIPIESVEVVPDQKVAAEAGMAADQKVAETHQPASGTPGAAGASLPGAALSHPPTSWSLASKAKWPMLPEHVRADIVQREAEASAEFRQYAPFKPLIKAAETRGKTPEILLQEFRTVEDVLRLDPDAGIRLILRRLANDLGIPQTQFRQWAGALCADVARAADHARAMH